eukprot:Hpha_TRINITY_DN12118_c0_g1::TRINITY_DN12118_c0_g1_i1::g.81892::m.81892/K01835/pgm; phosphoglucomutase
MGCCGSTEQGAKTRNVQAPQKAPPAQSRDVAASAPAPAPASAAAARQAEEAGQRAGVDALRASAVPDSPSKGLSLLRAAAGNSVEFSPKKVSTEPYDGQLPGTSGLRKKTRVFMQPNYLENFVQSVFDVLKEQGGSNFHGGKALVVSGDGRYHNTVAIQTIIKMAVANGVPKIWVGTDGLLSTPAVSAVIRSHGAGNGAFGGFILSASHNPGGIDEDFGIKYNCENGGPAPEKVTNAVAKRAQEIREYLSADGQDIDVSRTATYAISVREEGRTTTLDVFDAAEDHVKVLKQQFDFEEIGTFLRSGFSIVYDCMHGVQGPYARKVFLEEFGLPASSMIHLEPREDFGGKESAHKGHADPNLTYAVGLVKAMGLTAKGTKAEDAPASIPDFGAAADGDADRNMICGKQFFVSPSDSLAIIADHAEDIPGLRGLRGCARSMPTSGALDRVAQNKGYKFFEVPTGWKFFGNLMDSGDDRYFPGKPSFTPFLCGEESFGTGSSHVREKDGLWAALAWLQILAKKPAGTSVEDVVKAHWRKYGRNYYTRYDYEGVDLDNAKEMMAMMTRETEDADVLSKYAEYDLERADMFCYEDPVDGSISKNQGIRWIKKDGSRIIFRLSGTGTAGATVRLYLEQYVAPDAPEEDLYKQAADVTRDLAVHAAALSKFSEYFPEIKKDEAGIPTPTVMT